MLKLPGARARVEIEFAAKGTRRLRQILTGYRDTPRYGAVTWLVDTPAVAAAAGPANRGARRRDARMCL